MGVYHDNRFYSRVHECESAEEERSPLPINNSRSRSASISRSHTPRIGTPPLNPTHHLHHQIPIPSTNKRFTNASASTSNPYSHANPHDYGGSLPPQNHPQFPLSGASSVDSSHSNAGFANNGYFSTSAYPPSSNIYATSATSASQLDSYVPSLVHSWSPNHSILCVAASPTRKLLFCGTQDSQILIYDLESYSLARSISNGHKASVLTLLLSEDENYLFTAGSDSLVKVWDVDQLINNKPGNSESETDVKSPGSNKSVDAEVADDDEVSPIYVIYTFLDVGDIFSLSWSQEFKTLFIGTQNASILYCDLLFELDRKIENPDSFHNLPHVRFDKFFDSKGPGGSVNKLQTKHQLLRVTGCHEKAKLIEINQDHIIRFAHNGFIYCMVLVNKEDIANMFNTSIDSSYDIVLISAGGDSIVKIWGVKKTKDCYKWTLLESLVNDEEYEVLSISIEGTCLYAGLSNMILNVWDLTTFQLVRSISCGDDEEGNYGTEYPINTFVSNCDKADQLSDILSFAVYHDCIFKASHTGVTKYKLKHYPESTAGKGEFKTKLDKGSSDILFVEIFSSSISGKTYLLAGGNKLLNLWDISQLNDEYAQSDNTFGSTHLLDGTNLSTVSNESLLQELSTFISFRTVSKFPSLYLEESRRCAQFLTSLFIKLGASQTKLLPVPNGNPIVYSLFRANSKSLASTEQHPRILWYGHYDVVDADDDTWNTSPYQMTAKDGNLYARGVSDNKGPILAALFAVAELYKSEQLGCDVVFIVEGEEECGSIGFQKIISEHRGLIESGGPIDWIMLLNSYWLDDTTPCLNYGHRGVINALITIKSEKPDRHSGVDGGVSREPTMDLVHLLGSLSENGRIQLDNFYDNVRPITPDENELLLEIVRHHEDLDPANLIAKWSSPSLTIHTMNVSGPHNNTTVIPQTATASISIRIVPNQDLNQIKASLVKCLHSNFDQLNSENHLSVNIFHEAEPWLGNPKNDLYQVLYHNLVKHWNMTPLFIREGGSIPSIRFLEKCLNAPAAQIPCGQASDNAHLLNEKLRIVNLYKLRQVLTSTLTDIAKNNNLDVMT